MKNQFLIIAFLTSVLFITATVKVPAQNSNTVEHSIRTNGKYALLVQNANHLMASVITGEEFKNKSKNIQFEIILIGQVVKDLANNTELKSFIERAEKSGVKIVVCEFAMNKLGIQKSQYHKSIKTTPNGFTYLFGLQEQGFKTITL